MIEPTTNHFRSENRTRYLAGVQGVRLYDYGCTAERGDRPYTEQHSCFSISIVREGSFCYTENGRTHVLGPGAVLLANAGIEYNCSHEFGGKDRCTAIEYDTELLDDIQLGLDLRSRLSRPFSFSRPVLPLSPRIEAMHRMMWSSARGACDDVALDEAGFCLVAEVVAALSDANVPSSPKLPSRSRWVNLERSSAACRFIEDNFKKRLTLSDVAEAVHLSPYHFLRVFKNDVALTPHQYLVRVRLCRAVNLLRDTGLSVTDVSYESGFEDLSNFVRTFHHHVGCSPRSFRRGGLLQKSNILQESPRRS